MLQANYIGICIRIAIGIVSWSAAACSAPYTDLRKTRQYLKHVLVLQAMFLNEAGKIRNLLTADFHRFTRIRFLESQRMGASGHFSLQVRLESAPFDRME